MKGCNMLRLLTLLVFASLHSVKPVLSQTVLPEDQLLATMGTFLPNPNRGDVWQTHALLTNGLTGRWIMSADVLLTGGAQKLPADVIARACERSGADVSVTEFTIVVSRLFKRKDKSQGILKTVYADHGSGVYGFMADPENYLDAYGMANVTELKFLRTKYNLLRNASGIAQIYRPSKDVLVIVPLAAQAQLAMRCGS
jgi:hypothetical protein